MYDFQNNNVDEITPSAKAMVRRNQQMNQTMNDLNVISQGKKNSHVANHNDQNIVVSPKSQKEL